MQAVLYASDPEALAKLRAYAADHSLEVLGEPPALPDALALACAHHALLIVPRLADLARGVRELRDLTRRLRGAGADWLALAEAVSTTQKPTPRLIEAIDRIEHERRSRQISKARLVAHERGIRLGDPAHVRYGWTVDPEDTNRLVEHPGEQAAIARIREWRAAGRTLKEITEGLEAAGFPPRSGRWHLSTVASVLKRAGFKQAENKRQAG